MMNTSVSFEHAMDRAIQLARESDLPENTGNPIPKVGAVAVQSGRIVATGVRQENPNLHAEQALVNSAKENRVSIESSTVCVTLMPCESCAKELVKAKVKAVVVGIYDPNSRATHASYSVLQGGGVEVKTSTPDQKSEIRLIMCEFLEKFVALPHNVEQGVAERAHSLKKEYTAPTNELFTVEFGAGRGCNVCEVGVSSYFYGQTNMVAKIEKAHGTIIDPPDVDHLFPSRTHVQTLFQKDIGVLKGSTGYLLVSPHKIEFRNDEVDRVRFKLRFLEAQGIGLSTR
jgi:pyrimidine deaminase RibD-like protein